MHATWLVSEWTCINFEDLVSFLPVGILWFQADLDTDDYRGNIANAKVTRMLLDRPHFASEMPYMHIVNVAI
jgi:hypothetical protein